MNKTREILNEINTLSEICEAMRADIEASKDKHIMHGNENYAKYQRYIDAFVGKYDINSKDYETIVRYIYYSRSWTLDVKELDQIVNALKNTKQLLCGQIFEKIFISHSEKDEKIISLFIDLLHDIGIPRPTNFQKDKMIFCSSHPAYYIANRETFKERIRAEILSNEKAFYILWYSDNYFNSTPCLNEMGAIWVLSKPYQEILSLGFESKNIKGLLDTQPIWFIATDKYRLNTFKDEIVRLFALDEPEQNFWEAMRDKFIENVKTEMSLL